MKNIANVAEFATETASSPGWLLVDFYTQSCSPCRALIPVLEEIEQERSDVKVVKVDVTENLEVAARFHVSSVPTLVLLQHGEVRGQLRGLRSKKDLLGWLDSNR
jgi:thioredoxin 1